MIPQGFGDPIAGFAYTHNETRRDTPYLTIVHMPLSFGGFARRVAVRLRLRAISLRHLPHMLLGLFDG